MVTVDIAEAFDTLPHAAFLVHLRVQGIHLLVVGMMSSMYQAVTSTIPNGTTVKQGDRLSPPLLHIAIDAVFHDVEAFNGWLAYRDCKLQLLAFANDIALVAHSAVEAPEMLNTGTLESGITEYGLEVSLSKCTVF